MSVTVDVLVVDDSALMRQIITELVESDPLLRVIGTASNGSEALRKIDDLRPDVVTMDIEMPVMNGLEALRQLMERQPTPVIVLSGVHEASAALQSLELGAVDFLAKPSGAISVDMYRVRDNLVNKIKTATLCRFSPGLSSASSGSGPVRTRGKAAPGSRSAPSRHHTNIWLVIIGASTGGPRAVGTLLRQLPADLPAAIVAAIHMPPRFTASMAQRLDRVCDIAVSEAHHGMALAPGCAAIAPGGACIEIDEANGVMAASLTNGTAVDPPFPSIDLLMASAARLDSRYTLGVLLTGIGADGSQGLARLKAAGATTVAQDRDSCAIFGMPQAAINLGVVDHILPLEQIPAFIINTVLGLGSSDED